jgi:putative phosphoribosyl transferase
MDEKELILMFFNDRSHAGRLLAEALMKYSGKDTVVYALPRGGVVLGYEVSKMLGCPLDLVVTRKIGHPNNPEYAICAVSENAPPICNQLEISRLTEGWLDFQVSKQKGEIKRRKKTYPSPNISPKGKTAIIIDDGIATGLTIKSAIEEIKSQKPKLLIVAVPVSPKDTAEEISSNVDHLVCLDIQEYYLGAVGAYYADFSQVTDSEVVELLYLANRT